MSDVVPFVPSWLRWPPNCCETCVGWEASAHQQYVGLCNKGESLDCGTTTDTRYRCPSFQRRAGV